MEGNGGPSLRPQPRLGAPCSQRGWERATERVGGTAEMPISRHSGQEGSRAGARPMAGPSGDKPGQGALPLFLEAAWQAGGSFSSLPALVTTNANPVPATANGH